jgi:CBS domain-containing protein
MTTAREVMAHPARCVSVTDSVAHAARLMRELGVGALPICGDDGRVLGMVTESDIVRHCVADELDPAAVRVRQHAGGEIITIDADDDVVTALYTLAQSGARRLPVVDGRTVVGTISHSDIAAALPPEYAGSFLESMVPRSAAIG